jgi:hypothetical protein
MRKKSVIRRTRRKRFNSKVKHLSLCTEFFQPTRMLSSFDMSKKKHTVGSLFEAKLLVQALAHRHKISYSIFVDPYSKYMGEAFVVQPKSMRRPKNGYNLVTDYVPTLRNSRRRNRKPVKRRTRRNPLQWGKTEFSRGPLKSKAAVLALAKRLQAKRSPYAQHAGDYAQRYWDSILAQPGEQRRLLEIAARYPSPKRRTRRNPKGRRKLASRRAKRLSRQHRLWEREYQSHMGFLPYSGSRPFVKRKGRTYRPYARTRLTTSEVLSSFRDPFLSAHAIGRGTRFRR